MEWISFHGPRRPINGWWMPDNGQEKPQPPSEPYPPDYPWSPQSVGT